MNDSLLLWLVGGVAVALGLLLAFSTSAPAPVAENVPAVEVSEVASSTEEVGSEESSTTYWESVAGTATTGQYTVVYPVSAAAPCAVCGAYHAEVVAPAPPKLVGGCGSPDTPCARRDCHVCPPLVPSRPPTAPEPVVARCGSAPVSPCGFPGCPVCSRLTPSCSPAVPCGRPDCPVCMGTAPTCPTPLVGGCGTPVAPCAKPACSSAIHACGATCVPLCPAKPGINRNLPTCVDECAFVQLSATVPEPICTTTCFRWAATKGTFIDPTAKDPLYFAPAVQMPGGEDVLITLLITVSDGARYTDKIRLHVRNLP